MKYLILLTAFVLSFQLVKGSSLPSALAKIYCNDNHTVDVTISNVVDVDQWQEIEWRLEDNAGCDPVLSKADKTVTYTNLLLPDCAYRSIQDTDYIKYVLKINVTKPNPGNTYQLRAYDHLYYVSCEYDNQNRSTASFVPIVNRDTVNGTGNAFFTFSLQAFPYENHTGVVPSRIKLDQYLFFKAYVDTQSDNPNLDLFIVECFSSSSNEFASSSNRFKLINEGCGNNAVSEDLNDTLTYNCTDDSIKETFKLRTYRYFGFPEGSKVYIHCKLRVCLADQPNTTCECPSVDQCDPASRKRRSVEDLVDEAQVYRVTSGPFIFESDDKKREQVEEDEDEGEAYEQGESQSFSTNLIVIVVVSGVAAIAVCATIVFVVHSRNKRQQHGDLSIPT